MAKRKNITKRLVQAKEKTPFVPNVTVKPDTDDAPWDNDGLTIRQRAFVEALVGPAGGNATKAAEMAGYASDNRLALQVTASETLSKPMVQEAIARGLARKRMTPEWADERLYELASSSFRNFSELTPEGDMKVNWPQAFAHGAVGQISEVTEEILEASGSSKVIRRKLKMHPPHKALETIQKLTGRLKNEPQKIELTGPNGGPVPVKHEFDHARYREMFQRRTAGNGERTASENGN